MPALFPPISIGGAPLVAESPSPGGPAGIIVAQVPITTAQLQSAAATTTGIQLIAGAAGKILVPLWWGYSERRVAAFTSTPTFSIRYAGPIAGTTYAGMTNGGLGMLAGATTNTDFSAGQTVPGNQQNPNLTIPPNTSITGLALVLLLNTPLTGGGSHNGNPVFTVAYFELPVPF